MVSSYAVYPSQSSFGYQARSEVDQKVTYFNSLLLNFRTNHELKKATKQHSHLLNLSIFDALVKLSFGRAFFGVNKPVIQNEKMLKAKRLLKPQLAWEVETVGNETGPAMQPYYYCRLVTCFPCGLAK